MQFDCQIGVKFGLICYLANTAPYWEKLHFRYRTLLCLAVFRVAFEQLYESCWS